MNMFLRIYDEKKKPGARSNDTRRDNLFLDLSGWRKENYCTVHLARLRSTELFFITTPNLALPEFSF